jgi:hypothetical protein
MKFKPDYDQDYLPQLLKFYDQLAEVRDTHDWEVTKSWELTNFSGTNEPTEWTCRRCGMVETQDWKCERSCPAHLMQEALD